MTWDFHWAGWQWQWNFTPGDFFRGDLRKKAKRHGEFGGPF